MAAGDIACDPDGSGLQRRRRDGRPLPPAGHLGPARQHGRWTRCCRSATSSTTAPRPPGSTRVYDPTWGRVKSISRPILGNHESGAAAGYFDYFNGAGRRGRPGRRARQGLLQLRRRRLAPGRAQLELLERVVLGRLRAGALAAGRPRRASGELHARLLAPPALQLGARRQQRRSCSRSGRPSTTPRRSSSCRATATTTSASRRWTATATWTRRGGIRQFVVGTGGAFFTGGSGTLAPNSEVAQNDTFGVLKLTLHPASYDWQFVPEAGGDVHRFRLAGLPWPDRSSAAAPVGRGRHAPVITKLRLAPRPIRRKSHFRYRALGGSEGHVHDQAQGQGPLPDGRRIHASSASAGANERRFRARIRSAAAAAGDIQGPPAGGRCGRQPLRAQGRSASESYGGGVDIALCEDYVRRAGTGRPRRVKLLAIWLALVVLAVIGRLGRRCGAAARRGPPGPGGGARPGPGAVQAPRRSPPQPRPQQPPATDAAACARTCAAARPRTEPREQATRPSRASITAARRKPRPAERSDDGGAGQLPGAHQGAPPGRPDQRRLVVGVLRARRGGAAGAGAGERVDGVGRVACDEGAAAVSRRVGLGAGWWALWRALPAPAQRAERRSATAATRRPRVETAATAGTRPPA